MSDLYGFRQFLLDPDRRSLCRADSPVALTPKAFDVLLFLTQNPNRLVTKEELLQAVWGDVVVEEGNLTQYISHLRKAMGDSPEDSRLIVTIARKGYQFTPRVTVIARATDIPNHAPLQSATEQIPGNDTQPVKSATEREAAESKSSRLHLRSWLAGAALVAGVTLAFWAYWSHGHPVNLTASDTIVLAEVVNRTSDPVFDDALNSALRFATEQTPYLNILSTDKIFGALAQLNLPRTTQLSPETARKVCLQTNSKLVISQSIGDAGNGYRYQIQALECASGTTVAKEQVDTSQRSEVVHDLGVAVTRLRASLGEPRDSLARFNQPLETAASPSLEALQATSQATKLAQGADSQGAIKLYQRAIELDPNLAAAYGNMAATYLFLGNQELSESAYTRAYDLRDRLTEKDRLAYEIAYYSNVIGDWEKEYSSVLRLLDIFPRYVFAHASLKEGFSHLGQPDKAADEAAEVARLRPTAYYFGSAIQSVRLASRFNEAKAWLAKADALRFDSLLIRRERLIVAFASGDRDNVEKILRQEEGGNYREDFLHEHSLIDIQQGRFHSAEALRRQASAQASTAGADEWWTILSAMENAEVGKNVEARRYETAADVSPLERNSKMALALALARTGRTDEAGQLADQVSAERPEDTLIQHYYVPTIRASIKLQQSDPHAAIDLLRDTAKYDLAFTALFNYVYPAYIRGLAYLQLGDGQLAAAQFQKVIDNPGLSVRHVIGPLARLQLGRAQKMMGDETAARKSYETFLDLWKSADPDIPIYQQAKAEYAKFPKD